MNNVRAASWVWFCLCGVAVGCGYSAARVEPVDIDPSDASSAAMEMYDKDGDDALGEQELVAVPGIKRYYGQYDRDGDTKVSREEISQRFEDWANNRLALHSARVLVHLDGRPLGGATVTFVPEAYLGPNVKPAIGITQSNGVATLSHAHEDLPKTASGRPIPGVTSGTFKVEITHPSIKIPPRYNQSTELGEEVAFDLNQTGAPTLLSLRSK